MIAQVDNAEGYRLEWVAMIAQADNAEGYRLEWAEGYRLEWVADSGAGKDFGFN